MIAFDQIIFFNSNYVLEIILDQEMQELYSDEEYSDEDYDEEDHPDDMIFEQSRIPQTFEEMNAMFRSKVASLEPEIKKTVIEAPLEKAIISSTNMTSMPPVREPIRPIGESKSDPPIILPEEEYDEEEIEYDDEEHDDEYEEDEEEIGDEEEEEEEIADEEEYEEEEAELSDVDDYDLMKRLEEKYGKIKEPTHHSDEDEDDPSWTSKYLNRNSIFL